MRKLSVFNFITLNGFFKGPGGDISWHKHLQGEEEIEFSEKSSKSGNMILFGRVTYEMMSGFWPTPEAITNLPVVAEAMNSADKIVFSRTLKKAEWNNTKLIKDNMVDEIKKMKSTTGKDMTILGSGSIVTQCAEHNLVDEFLLMLDPVAIGDGTPLLKGIHQMLELKLTDVKAFKSGIVLLSYIPVRKNS